MAAGRSSEGLATGVRPPGEALYRKVIAERRIAEKLTAERRELIEERRRRYGPDGPGDAADDEAFFRRVPAEAFFLRVGRERGEGEEKSR
jgi:hypothetical protein